MPEDTDVLTVPDESSCNYTSSNDLYCFPTENAFISMTGWTRLFYNRNYGLINKSGLVDVTMHFAADDEPAASWLGVENTGNIPINVNISWFTSTLAPQATYSAADLYYFYVRPDSSVYNSYPTGSSMGPTFYAVQTPQEDVAVAVSTTSSPSTAATATTSTISSTGPAATSTAAASNSKSSNSGNGLSRGAIALFFVLILLGVVLLLLMRRRRYAEAAANNQEKSRQTAVVPGNLFTPNEYAAAGAYTPATGNRPSVDHTESNDSVPVVVHEPPLVRRPSGLARLLTYTRSPSQAP